MNLIPWRKKRNDGGMVKADRSSTGLDTFRSEMDRLFDRFWSDPWNLFGNLPRTWEGWMPVVDVVDGEREIVVRAEIPGVDPKKVEVSVSGNQLVIAGEKRESRERGNGGNRTSECSYGSFQRSVPLPEYADAERVSADYDAGVLTVRIGKSEKAVPKRIPVSVK